VFHVVLEDVPATDEGKVQWPLGNVIARFAHSEETYFDEGASGCSGISEIAASPASAAESRLKARPHPSGQARKPL
jgi:hypothetical protein